ncbi:adenosylcobinamide-phosphate synthase CbiB [Iodidimonas sp. SYSU 1G8]|uniref:adenosylcobinamide-phosphate synthase CbiB n=1 Tax=Iodidimonas sp. SYSU 1G8 TaxID=3133967 RepID=UPI0031FF0EE7
MDAPALTLMAIALLIDALGGDPRILYRHVPHPVTMMGWGIAFLDNALNSPARPVEYRRLAGAVSLGLLIIATAAVAWSVHGLLARVTGGWLVEAVLASTLLAQRSLYDHVAAVHRALIHEGLEGGRAAVSMIVGRDVRGLDEAGVRRAAIESLAENLSDGVVAPLFWGCLFGLPGIAVYKLVNTADSMIGHRTPRHEAYGWAAARMDDALNWIPARLSGVLIALCAGATAARALRVMRRDARHHRSPNAGWPEAAMAGALGVRLSGPRLYAGRMSAEPWLGVDGADPGGHHMQRALAITVRVFVLLFVLVAAAALILSV